MQTMEKSPSRHLHVDISNWLILPGGRKIGGAAFAPKTGQLWALIEETSTVCLFNGYFPLLQPFYEIFYSWKVPARWTALFIATTLLRNLLRQKRVCSLGTTFHHCNLSMKSSIGSTTAKKYLRVHWARLPPCEISMDSPRLRSADTWIWQLGTSTNFINIDVKI